MTAGLASYPTVTATTTFKVVIADCVLTSFTAPTMSTKSSTIYSGAQLSFSIPTYTQVPACAYSVGYIATIKKTANANANRVSYFPDLTTTYPITATGLIIGAQALKFITFTMVAGVSPTADFKVYTDDLRD